MKRGFTLIEVLVSTAIFSVVMLIALGALLVMSASDRKAESIRSVADSINFTLDSMSRSIRTGYGYHCGSLTGQDCSAGATSFYFSTANGLSVGYRFDTTNGSLCGQTGTIGCIERSIDGGASWFPLTAPEVVVTGLMFYVRGSQFSSADNTQPIVTVTLSAYTVVTGTATTPSQCGTAGNLCSQFNLQTSITQRIYDQ